MKTIFIILTRGMMVRNILRSGTLALLQKNHRIVLLFPENTGHALPDYFYKEFQCENTIIEIVPRVNYSKMYVLFSHAAKFLTPSKSFWKYLQIGKANLYKSRVGQAVKRVFFEVFGRIHVLKTLARHIEYRYFTHDAYAHYFEKYQPAVVFGTSIVSSIDMDFMKEARKRGVPTISMTKGWDLTTKMLYRVVSDKIVVLNEPMRQSLIDVQKIPGEQIVTIGFPHFDWYKRPEIIKPRAEFLSSLGLDPTRRMLFYGSEGMWTPNDSLIASALVKAINTPGMLREPCSLVIRPHYSDIKNKTFDFLKNEPNVYVDDHLNRVEFFVDNWDPTDEEMIHLVNVIHHSAVVIAIASTLSLDGACLDKPIINPAYNAMLYNGKDFSKILYHSEHYEWVMSTDGTELVYSDDELFTAINQNLEHPETRAAQREHLREKLCFKVDGQSSLRLANAIESMIK